MEKVRLNKWLSMQGVCSRRNADGLIALGKVEINGEVVRELFTRIDPEKDVVVVSGKKLGATPAPIFLMLNKPAGYTCSHRRFGDDKLVYDLLPKEYGRLFSIGRLDRDSRGLLLLTNDGNLSHELIHPSFDVEKEYIAQTVQPIQKSDIIALKKGIMLDDTLCVAVKCDLIDRQSARLVIMEGKKRQIRRMFEELGLTVSDLVRVRVGSYLLGNLKEGTFQTLPIPK